MPTPPPIHILHLEDCPEDAALIEHKLTTAGLACVVTLVSNEREYIGALTDGGFDLILCDHNLADYDGISALRLAQQLYPLTPVMLISGFLDDEEAVKCLKTGATDYLLKQKLERLPAAVTRALTEAAEHRQRKLAEDRNRELALLLDKAQDAIYVRGLDQRITYWNQGAERLYGWKAEEVLGRPVSDLLYKKEAPESPAIHQIVLTTGEWVGELRQVTREGREVTVMGRRNLLRSEAGAPLSILNINTDITEKKKLEAELSRTQRLQSSIALAGGIAHDLKNALGPILMAAEMLKLRHPEDNDLVNMVSTNALRGADMARQLMIFARGAEGARLVVQPQQLLRRMQATIWDTFPKSIALITRFPDDLPAILGDAAQLQQVLHHLCVNARDAMPDGGCLTLEAEAVRLDASDTRLISDARPGNYVLWSITDTGRGIPPEVKERIFEPFFSTKKARGKSTGFGLSTLMGIVRSHGGFIQVFSTPPQGTTFAVYLPADEVAPLVPVIAPVTFFAPAAVAVPPALAVAAAIAVPAVVAVPATIAVPVVVAVVAAVAAAARGAAALPVPQAPLLQGEGEMILLVERDATQRQLTHTALTALGFEVITAGEVTEAIVQIIGTGDRRSHLRTVITDLHMPHMNGFAFLQVIKRMLPLAEIIASSSPQDADQAESCRSLGMMDLPAHALSEAELVRALTTVVENRRTKPLPKKPAPAAEYFPPHSRTHHRRAHLGLGLGLGLPARGALVQQPSFSER